MPRDDGQHRKRQITLDDVQVGATTSARGDPQPHATGSWLRERAVDGFERPRRDLRRARELLRADASRAHDTTKVAPPLMAAPPDSTRVPNSSMSTLRSPASSYRRGTLPEQTRGSPGQTCSRNWTAYRRTFAAPNQSVANAARIPACSIPTENTDGYPADCANSSSW